MTIPRRKTRLLKFDDGRAFRFMTKLVPATCQRIAQDAEDNPKDICVTVQIEMKNPGQVLQFRTPHYPEQSSLSPNQIVAKIELALSRGWTPTKPGAAFVLTSEP